MRTLTSCIAAQEGLGLLHRIVNRVVEDQVLLPARLLAGGALRLDDARSLQRVDDAVTARLRPQRLQVHAVLLSRRTNFYVNCKLHGSNTRRWSALTSRKCGRMCQRSGVV